jgi:hypothetical protein
MEVRVLHLGLQFFASNPQIAVTSRIMFQLSNAFLEECDAGVGLNNLRMQVV